MGLLVAAVAAVVVALPPVAVVPAAFAVEAVLPASALQGALIRNLCMPSLGFLKSVQSDQKSRNIFLYFIFSIYLFPFGNVHTICGI